MHPKSLANLKRGNNPRKPGSLNRETLEIRAAARALIEDPQYVAALKQRLIAGTAPTIELALYYYAYGKPVDRIEIVKPIVQEIHRLADELGMTPEEVLAEAEAIAQGRDG